MTETAPRRNRTRAAPSRPPLRNTIPQQRVSPESDETPVQKDTVLVFAGLFEPGFMGGGPVRSMQRIMDTAPDTADVYLVTRDRDEGSRTPYDGIRAGTWLARGPSKVFYLDQASPSQWAALLRRLWPIRRARLLYVNSMFDRQFSMVPVILAWLRVLRPELVLIAPRGEFSPGALAHHEGRKRRFLLLWRALLKGLPVLFHASTEREADEIRAVLAGVPVVVVLNQTALPSSSLAVRETNGDTLRLVFVSRISRKKNLAAVLEGLREVETPVELDVYGPREDAAYWARCDALTRQLPGHVTVHYRGHAEPGQVREVFAGHDAFVFPTLGENFGHVIAESLSASCPVLCPDTTPWTSVLEGGGGLVLASTEASAVTAALKELASLTPQERFAMRVEAGRAYEHWRASNGEVNVIQAVLERLQSA